MGMGVDVHGKDATKAPPAIAGVDLDQLLGGGKEKGTQGPGTLGGNGNGGSKPAEPPVVALETAIGHGCELAGRKFRSPALVATIAHVPVPLVKVSAPVAASTWHAVDTPALKLSAPVPLPPPPTTLRPFCP